MPYGPTGPDLRVGSTAAFLAAQACVTLGRPDRRPTADRMTERYLRDMFTSYGVDVSGPVRAVGHHNSYARLLERLVSELRPLPPLDLVVLAHARSDCDPRRSLSGTVNALCPGEPLCFAVSDQGEPAAVTALDLADRYLRHGWAGHALVVLLDQSTHAGAQVRGPAEDLAVGLLLRAADGDAADGWVLRSPRASAIGPVGPAPGLAALGSALPPLPDRARVVVAGPRSALGPAQGARWPGRPDVDVTLRPVAASQPPMAVWRTGAETLAQGTARWDRVCVVHAGAVAGTWEFCAFDAVTTRGEGE